ncbi:uncharacterized protein LOC108741683 [Agrilus planipennis]|uniref:Uncharacterized protein LOC108741683 n=1 Tax=Agrilus planipennis TaxID=224129 RepID=A0A1W4X7Q1_AGRPL|nr:uncharacterized protein LOC108741683 [Agrilus planipennis]
MKTISTLLLVAFLALLWSYGEAQQCQNCSLRIWIVCGRNRNGNERRFRNLCVMNQYNCLNGENYSFVRNGSCPNEFFKSQSYDETESLDQVKACSTCSGDFEPLCGRNENGDRRTFSNTCALNRYNCLTGEGYKFFKNGLCFQKKAHPNLPVSVN